MRQPTQHYTPNSKVKTMSYSEASNIIPLERPVTHAEEKDDRYLRTIAEQVRNHSRSSTKSIIAIGDALRDAKPHLGHGKSADGWKLNAASPSARPTIICAPLNSPTKAKPFRV